MDKRLDEWFEIYGRRLAELKIAGGEEYFVSGERSSVKLDNLTGNQWIEFFTLIGQLDGLAWALQPESATQAKKFQKEIAKRMDKIEKNCRHILKVTGKLSIPRGEA